MSPAPKLLIIIGFIFLAAGLLWYFFPRLFESLGQLPGDFSYKNNNVQFHFPLMTSLILSIVLSLLLWLFNQK